MMQWTPYGTTAADLKEHIRTFATVFPHVIAVRGFAGYGFYMLGSMQPISLDPAVAPRSWRALESSRTSRARSTHRPRRSMAGWPRSSARLARGRPGPRVRGTGPADHR